jgi:hypothetical protein
LFVLTVNFINNNNWSITILHDKVLIGIGIMDK